MSREQRELLRERERGYGEVENGDGP